MLEESSYLSLELFHLFILRQDVFHKRVVFGKQVGLDHRLLSKLSLQYRDLGLRNRTEASMRITDTINET